MFKKKATQPAEPGKADGSERSCRAPGASPAETWSLTLKDQRRRNGGVGQSRKSRSSSIAH